MAEDRGDKTEWASARKREDARKKGLFAHSHDLTQAALLLGGLLFLSCCGGALAQAQVSLLHNWLGHLSPDQDLSNILTSQWPRAAGPLALVTVALLSAVAAAIVAAEVLQAGLHVNAEAMAPKWERLNPWGGITRLFSLTSVVGTLVGILKIGVISWAAWRVLRLLFSQAPDWWHLPAGALLPLCGDWAMQMGYSVVWPMLLLAALDYGYKRWQYEKDIMMSREDMREEQRQQDGDPQIKARIRRLQRLAATRRMMQQVPKASVVVTNPTHVAVALRYEPGVTAAPVVVAKGEHLLAARIRAVAAAHGIPIVEEPPLARAMLRSLDVGQQISLEFYRAVAEILAVLHRARLKRAVGLPGRCA